MYIFYLLIERQITVIIIFEDMLNKYQIVQILVSRNK